MGNLLTRLWKLFMTCMCSSRTDDDTTNEREPLLRPSPDPHDQAECGAASVEPKRPLPVAPAPEPEPEPEPEPKRRALLIGICYGECGPQEDLSKLEGPHKDVTAMRSLLIGAWRFSV